MAGKMIKSMSMNNTSTVKSNEYGLSARELEVLHKLASGLRNQDIAEALFLSEGTVKNYISSTYSKLQVKGRREAARIARDSGILDHK
ncbi:response regulator transcription factor [Paenibacillus polymyxa]|nr:response regulator transcription factor [Paenibacillus polymyxa]